MDFESKAKRFAWLNRGAIPIVCLAMLVLGAYFQALGALTAVRAADSVQRRLPLSAKVLYVMDSRYSQGQNMGPSLRLQYLLYGKPYHVSLDLGSWPPNPPDGVTASDWARRIETGGPVTVYVDPHLPEDCVLDPRPTLTHELMMLLAAPITLVGLLGILTERAQKWVNVEALAVFWGVFVLVVYAAGHALGLATGASLALYFLALSGVLRIIRNSELKTIEEDLDAPPMDLSDFRP